MKLYQIQIGLVLGLLQTSACATGANICAEGTIAGRLVSTRVDSQLAADYLQEGRLPEGLGPVEIFESGPGHALARGQLADVANEHSPDLATLMFVDALQRQSVHAEIQREYESAQGRPVDFSGVPEDLHLLFVPGWLYLDRPENGSDFSEQRQKLVELGIPTTLLAVDENGDVESNGRLIAEHLATLSAAGKRIIVVSASKSGAEVALALGKHLVQRPNTQVLAWVNVVGVVRGSPLADMALKPPIRRWLSGRLARDGFDLRGLESLQTAVGRERIQPLRFPPELLRISYIALPLSGDIGKRARGFYRRLRRHGPNDGMTLLVDELVPGGLVVLEPGSDHYLDRPNQVQRGLALLRVTLSRLGLLSED